MRNTFLTFEWYKNLCQTISFYFVQFGPQISHCADGAGVPVWLVSQTLYRNPRTQKDEWKDGRTDSLIKILGHILEGRMHGRQFRSNLSLTNIWINGLRDQQTATPTDRHSL